MFIFEFSISKLWKWKSGKKVKWKSSLTISLFNLHLPDKHGGKKCQKWRWGWKDLEEWIWFLNSPYSPYVNYHENLREKIDPFFKTFLTNRGKNEIVNEKIWENEFDLWILHIKVRLYGNFHENLWKKNFDQFFRTLLTNRGKNEIEDEKYEKMNSILNSLYQN